MESTIKETEHFVYESEDEKRLGEIIVDVLEKHNKTNALGGFFSTFKVGIALCGIQRKCDHNHPHESLVDDEGVTRSVCTNCALC